MSEPFAATHLPQQTRRQSVAIFTLKALHSIIFLVDSAAVLHIFYTGVRDQPSRWTRPALVAALLESAVFIVNRGRCPIASMTESLGAKSGRVSDIFLPRWFAGRIPQLCSPPLLIGLIGLANHAGRRPPARIARTSSLPAASPTRRETGRVGSQLSYGCRDGHPPVPRR